MKYILLVGDGMADRPLEELGGKTVLEASSTKNMDEIASKGKSGLVKTVPQGMIPASDVANLSILGYDPKKYYCGRGPLEAANMNIDIGETDVAFRCNTVTVGDDKMIDYSAGHITTKESSVLINYLDEKKANQNVRFYPGVGYRHLMVVNCELKKDAQRLNDIKCMAPHDILEKRISKNLPKGAQSEFLVDIMNRSRTLLMTHEVNKVRIDLNENPANMIWLWGQGMRPNIPTFKELYNLDGNVISAVDLVNGMGKIVGLKPIKVPGATGYYDTNYTGKGEYALDALKNSDFIYVHVEAPDEAGHNGDVRSKMVAIENFDRYVVGTIWNEIKNKNNYRILVLPDHATPVKLKTHTQEPVPFALCGTGISADNTRVYSERAAKSSGLFVKNGYELIKSLIKK